MRRIILLFHVCILTPFFYIHESYSAGDEEKEREKRMEYTKISSSFSNPEEFLEMVGKGNNNLLSCLMSLSAKENELFSSKWSSEKLFRFLISTLSNENPDVREEAQKTLDLF